MCDTLQLNWKLPPAGKKDGPVGDKEADDGAKKKANKKGGKKKGKNYALRECSIKKRTETAERRKAPKQTGPPKKRGPKPRPRPLPMSKYRRKTANLRERMRMGEINSAFEVLREKIPALSHLGGSRCEGGGGSKCEKMTKINILHVAIGYIRAMENLLDTGDAGVNVYGTACVQSPSAPIQPECIMDVDDNGGAGQASSSPVKSKKKTPKKSATPNGGVGTSKKSPRKAPPAMSSATSVAMTTDVTKDEYSGSEDSGINSEGADSPSSSSTGFDDDLEECPDWTELTCTLEFNQQQQAMPHFSDPPENMDQQPPSAKAPMPPTLTRGNLDTLLTLSASHMGGGHKFSGEDAVLRKMSSLQPTMTMMRSTSRESTKSFGRQSSFPDLGDDVGDLFGGCPGMDDFGDISFVHDGDAADPFQLIM